MRSLTSSESQDQVESAFLLNVVVRESSTVFELLTSEDKSLLIGWDSFFILDLCLDILNSVRWFNVQGNGFTSEGLDKDLHTTSESEDQMESRFFLDVVVRKGSAVFKLFAGENESLLIGWDTFLVLDFSLDVFNGVWWLDIESDGLASQGLNEDLHTSSESEDQVEGWFFLNVVVGEGSTVFQLLSSKDESLLIGWDTFFVLDLGFDVFNGVWWFNVKSNSLSGEGFNEDLHDCECFN